MAKTERIKIKNGPIIDLEIVEMPLEENVRLDEWGKTIQKYIDLRQYDKAIRLVDEMYDISRAEGQYARVLFYSELRENIKKLHKY